MTNVFNYLMRSKTPKVVTWVSEYSLSAASMIRHTFGGFLMKSSVSDGVFTVGPHTIVIVTPRHEQRSRGYRTDAVYIESWEAYEKVRQVLLWSCAGGDEPTVYFGHKGPLTGDQP